MIMKIEFTRDGDKLTAAISGRIDTNSAPEAEEQILNQLVLEITGFLDILNVEENTVEES